MAMSFYSTVFDQSADEVWSVVRDFDNYPHYIEGVDESVIEDNRPGDSVGAVRRFRHNGQYVRQRLLAYSDRDRSFTYAGLSPLNFPETDGSRDILSSLAIQYEGTLRITPVIDGERSFVEWWVNFNCSSDERDRWQTFLNQAILQWMTSLRNYMDT